MVAGTKGSFSIGKNIRDSIGGSHCHYAATRLQCGRGDRHKRTKEQIDIQKYGHHRCIKPPCDDGLINSS